LEAGDLGSTAHYVITWKRGGGARVRDEEERRVPGLGGAHGDALLGKVVVERRRRGQDYERLQGLQRLGFSSSGVGHRPLLAALLGLAGGW